jgi:hypothetical protein
MMPKYKKKSLSVEANLIEFSNPGKWPVGVQNNIESPTGVSYLSLTEQQVPGQSAGSVFVAGIPIKDKSWLVIDANGVASNLSDEEFQKRFEL